MEKKKVWCTLLLDDGCKDSNGREKIKQIMSIEYTYISLELFFDFLKRLILSQINYDLLSK